jgi:hypothetical protein
MFKLRIDAACQDQIAQERTGATGGGQRKAQPIAPNLEFTEQANAQ